MISRFLKVVVRGLASALSCLVLVLGPTACSVVDDVAELLTSTPASTGVSTEPSGSRQPKVQSGAAEALDSAEQADPSELATPDRLENEKEPKRTLSGGLKTAEADEAQPRAAPRPIPAIPRRKPELQVQSVESLLLARLRAERSATACLAYREEVPRREEPQEVRDICAAAEWQQVQHASAPGPIQAWLEAYPDSAHRAQAETVLEELLFDAVEAERSPESCKAYQLYFSGAFREGRVAHVCAAIRTWERALSLDTVQGYRDFISEFPDTPEASVAKSRTDPVYWDSKIRRNPEDAHARLQFAMSCEAASSCPNSEVLKHLKKALEQRPNHAPTHLWHGIFAFREKHYADARNSLEIARELDDGQALVHRHLGHIEKVENGCTKVVIRHYEKAKDIEPGSVETLYYLADCLDLARQCERAATIWQRIIDLADGSTQKSVALARSRQKICD